jgi:phage-related minor tail protein
LGRFLSGSVAKIREKKSLRTARVAVRPHQLSLKNFCRFLAEIFATIFDALPQFLLRFAVRSHASIWFRATTILFCDWQI